MARVVQDGGGRLLRGVETGPVGGVGEARVGLLEAGALLGRAGRLGGLGEQRGPLLQLAGACGHPGGTAARLRQLLFEGGLFPYQAVAEGGAGGGPALGRVAFGDAALVFPPGGVEPVPDGVQPFGGRPRPLVLPGEPRRLGRQPGHLGGGGGGRRGGQLLPYDAQGAFGLGPPRVAPAVGGVRRVLGALVDMAVGAGGRVRVGGGAADLAGLAVGEAVGEFGGDVGEPGLLQLQPVALRGGRFLPGGERGGAGPVGVGGQGVPAAGGGEPFAGGAEEGGEPVGVGGGVAGLGLLALEPGAGGVPALQPLRGLGQQRLVGLLVTVDAVQFAGQLGVAPLGPAGGGEGAQLLDGGAGERGQPGGGDGVFGGERGAGRLLGAAGACVGPLGGVPEVERPLHGGGLAGAGEAGEPFLVGLGGGGQPLAARVQLSGALLEAVEFAGLVQGAPGGGLFLFGGGEGEAGDGPAFAQVGAGGGGPAEYVGGEPRLARLGLGDGHAGGLPRDLPHPLEGGEQHPVALLDAVGGGPAQLGEVLLDGGEPAGVEEPSQQPPPGLGVGAQEPGEVPLRQQDDLAELLLAHAEQLGDLLAGLLVGAAEVAPGAGGGVVLAQPGLCLVDRGAAWRASWGAPRPAGG